jgi:hypothetical protein
MELDTVTMDRDAARRAFLDYRREVREARTKALDEAQRRQLADDEAIMSGYRVLMRGRQVLRLSSTLASGGYTSRTGTAPAWAASERRKLQRVPRLAIMRADAEFAYTMGVEDDGSVIFTDEPTWLPDRWVRKRRTLPSGTFPEYDRRYPDRLVARVPHVPPTLRPNGSLGRYDVLWEAEWAKADPRPPRDPALLRLIGGDLYAVVALWELTELERAVLGGRA